MSCIAWLLVAAYFFTTIIAIKLALSSSLRQLEHSIKHKRFWLIIASIIFFLGVIKYFGLVSLLSGIGRYYAYRDGWYERRGAFQVVFIIGITTFILIAAMCFKYQSTGIWRNNWLTVMALFYLLLLVLIRIISFHYIDSLIYSSFMGVRLYWVLELSGVFCIGYTALTFTRKLNRKKI